MAESLQGLPIDIEPACPVASSLHPPAGLILLVVLALFSSAYFSRIIAPRGLGTNAPTAWSGLYPEWAGSREILLHRQSPYRWEVTHKIQAALGGDRERTSTQNQQRFAYPAYFAFLFAPLALLPFSAAAALAFCGCLASVVVCLGAWSRCLSLNRRTQWLALAAALSTYPFALGLQLCQPTMIISCGLALAAYFAHSGRLPWAGIMAGMTTAKPHVALGVLLPLAVWAASDWRARKSFLLCFAGTTVALVAGSELLVPGWIGDWLATVSAYAHYAGTAPLVVALLRHHGATPATVLLVSAAIWVSYRFRRDVQFAIAFSVAAFQLIFPFLIYNVVLLLPAALWLRKHTASTRSSGQIVTLLSGCSWIVLSSGVISAVGLSLADLLAPGWAGKLWPLPLIAAWCYPPLLFAALSAIAVRREFRLP